MDVVLIFVVPFIGLCGVIIGALLQAFLNRKNQKVSHLSELQNKSYADFLNAASKCSGQLKLATVLEFSQYSRSDSLGVRPPLY